MIVIDAQNVNDAYCCGLYHLTQNGERQPSRAGDVLVSPCPVTTVYHRPMERVLFDPRRDANPFFHLFESLWMLSGSRDATWLDRFVGDFSERFAEEGGEQHGAYGYRWRKHFEMEGGGVPLNWWMEQPDQIETVCAMLKKNPDDRRMVITMWDPIADLGADKRDIPCNTHIYPRVRNLIEPEEDEHGAPRLRVLDITVCCRSNDAVWGAYGANAVHFSVLQEYMAARIGVSVGTYYQVSNNFHVYTDVLSKVWPAKLSMEEMVPFQPYNYPETRPQRMVLVPEKFNVDLAQFMKWANNCDGDELPVSNWNYANSWFRTTAEALFEAHWYWKHKKRETAFKLVSDLEGEEIAPDWRQAAEAWMGRRLKLGDVSNDRK